jgi:hypothetical protein
MFSNGNSFGGSSTCIGVQTDAPKHTWDMLMSRVTGAVGFNPWKF